MLSKAASALLKQNSKLIVACARTSATTPANFNAAASAPAGSSDQFIRPVRPEFPGKVRHGFIPEEFFEVFYKKTGVTGPYTFFVTLTTYLVSKEIYVLEHEFYTGVSLFLLLFIGIKKFGPAAAAYFDKEIDAYEAQLNESRVNEKKCLKESIEAEEKAQWSLEGQNILVEAKRENVALQLEASYRERLLAAYQAVKGRLDYQVEKLNVEQRISQRNLVDYVVAKVKASITPDQEKQNINKCIADLAQLAKA